MIRRVYLKYPCGKKFEIRVPITVIRADGTTCSVLPGADTYFNCAKQKFEINNLKVIEEQTLDKTPIIPPSFISLTKKIRCVE